MANGGELTYFAQLPPEHEFQETAASSGIFNGLFGRFFKSAQSSAIEGASEVQPVDNVHSPVVTGDFKDDANSATDVVKKDDDEEKPNPEVRGVSSRLSSLFRSRKSSLIDYNRFFDGKFRSSFRRYWMPDSTGKECYECQERFTAFRRRHHCRLCGQIFCAKCCSIQVPGSLLGYMGDLRVCGYCAKVVVTYLPQGFSTSESQQQEGREEPLEREQPASIVSTISAGSMLWLGEPSINSGTEEASFSEKVEDNGPSSSSQLPSLLSVLDLAEKRENSNKYPSLNVLVEHCPAVIDDLEPEWVRSIEMSTTRSLNKAEDSNFTTTSTSDACSSNDNFDACLNGADDVVKTYGSGLLTDSDETPLLDVPLEKAFEERIQSLLLYLFEREMLDSSIWWDVIWPMSRQIAASVKADVENRKDHMNILNYVHIKKVWVDDLKPSAVVVNGVVCSKSISHAHMPDTVTNASVLALAGGLEYERVSEKLSFIEPIVMQENEYLSKQVERIMAYRPSIVLVENNVAYVAVRMLLRAGVTLVSNLKTQVLHRIARCTRADVMPSLDVQILQQKVGFCSSFKQQTIRLANGKRKTILIFSECSSDLGCSVILRSNSQWQLRCAKRILRFVILALYSARLEVQFLSLSGTLLSKRVRDCVVCSLNVDEPDSDEDGFANRLKKCTLSTSPFIEFGVPFLETAKGRCCALRPYFKHPLYKHSTKEDIAKIKTEYDNIEASMKVKRIVKSETNSYLQHKLVANKKLSEISEDDVASYRAFSGMLFKRRVTIDDVDYQKKLSEVDFHFHDDVFDPLIHQKIAILFGSFSPKSPNAPLFCVRPWVVQMEHYGTNDMTLGDFLRKFCFNKDYQCPSSNCEVPMLEHARKIVYRNVCIEITTQDCVRHLDETSAISQQSSNQKADTVICWHYCSSCKATSAVMPLSELASRMSFSRYIDYLANGGLATCNIYAFSKKCEHCCFHQHDHFFAFNTEVTLFKMHPVKPFHVKFSPVVCTVDAVMFTRKFVADKENEIRQTASAIFKTMNSQLINFSQNPDLTKFISYYDTLKCALDGAQNQFNEMMKQFDPSGALCNGVLTIRSNDAVYIKALDTETRCRYIIQRLINLWNEQSTSLIQVMRTYKKGVGIISSHTLTVNSSGETLKSEQANGSGSILKSSASASSLSEFELTSIESPFLSQLHLGLPPPIPGMTAVVRDIIDRKGNAHPDVGSIIAYALSSTEYEAKLQKLRDLGHDSPLKTVTQETEPNGLQEHVELDFSDERAQYFVKIYYAENFHLLRKLLFVEGEECFIRSLSVSSGWNPQGGKSGASFYRTQDERFVFKQMSRFEIQSFLKFAPNYFNYISTAVTENKLTTLCKVYGVYRIGYKNKLTGSQLKLDMLVMEYLFYKRNVKQVWDLKGSQRNRMAAEGKKTADLVLLDENLIKDLWNNQLYVHPHSKAALNMAISNDSHFLSAQHVMDYSLLVGVDETNSELILGIVDYMRTYTLDKKLESWVKIVAIPGSLLPTVISPVMYCTRFSDAMDIYFPVAPDQWTGLGSSVTY